MDPFGDLEGTGAPNDGADCFSDPFADMPPAADNPFGDGEGGGGANPLEQPGQPESEPAESPPASDGTAVVTAGGEASLEVFEEDPFGEVGETMEGIPEEGGEAFDGDPFVDDFEAEGTLGGQPTVGGADGVGAADDGGFDAFGDQDVPDTEDVFGEEEEVQDEPAAPPAAVTTATVDDFDDYQDSSSDGQEAFDAGDVPGAGAEPFDAFSEPGGAGVGEPVASPSSPSSSSSSDQSAPQQETGHAFSTEGGDAVDPSPSAQAQPLDGLGGQGGEAGPDEDGFADPFAAIGRPHQESADSSSDEESSVGGEAFTQPVLQQQSPVLEEDPFGDEAFGATQDFAGDDEGDPFDDPVLGGGGTARSQPSKASGATSGAGGRGGDPFDDFEEPPTLPSRPPRNTNNNNNNQVAKSAAAADVFGDDFFGSNTSNSAPAGDDAFFADSKPSKKSADDVFGDAFGGSSKPASQGVEDMFDLQSSAPQPSQKPQGKPASQTDAFDDLFGSSEGAAASTTTTTTSAPSTDDPFAALAGERTVQNGSSGKGFPVSAVAERIAKHTPATTSSSGDVFGDDPFGESPAPSKPAAQNRTTADDPFDGFFESTEQTSPQPREGRKKTQGSSGDPFGDDEGSGFVAGFGDPFGDSHSGGGGDKGGGDDPFGDSEGAGDRKSQDDPFAVFGGEGVSANPKPRPPSSPPPQLPRRRNQGGASKSSGEGKSGGACDVTNKGTVLMDVDVLAYMQQGGTFFKYGRAGHPHFRFFMVTPNGQRLMWFSKSKSLAETCIQLSSIKRVVLGQHTKTFERLPSPELRHMSFSIYYHHPKGEKTLDVVAKDPNDLVVWVAGLREMLKRRQSHGIAYSKRKVKSKVDGKVHEVPSMVLKVPVRAQKHSTPRLRCVKHNGCTADQVRKVPPLSEIPVTQRSKKRRRAQPGNRQKMTKQLGKDLEKLKYKIGKRGREIRDQDGNMRSYPVWKRRMAWLMGVVQASCGECDALYRVRELEMCDEALWRANSELEALKEMVHAVRAEGKRAAAGRRMLRK